MLLVKTCLSSLVCLKVFVISLIWVLVFGSCSTTCLEIILPQNGMLVPLKWHLSSLSLSILLCISATHCVVFYHNLPIFIRSYNENVISSAEYIWLFFENFIGPPVEYISCWDCSRWWSFASVPAK